MIPQDVTVDHVGQATFEGAPRFGRRLALGEFAQVVDLSGAGIAALADGNGVQHRVQLPVAAGVETVAYLLSAGGVQWRSAGVAGEVVAGRESVMSPM